MWYMQFLFTGWKRVENKGAFCRESVCIKGECVFRERAAGIINMHRAKENENMLKCE